MHFGVIFVYEKKKYDYIIMIADITIGLLNYIM